MLDFEPEQLFKLAGGDGDGGGGREAGRHRHGYEVDDEAQLEDPQDHDDDATEEGQEDDEGGAFVGVLRRQQGHDGSRADRDVLAASEDEVNEAAHEGRVKAILQKQDDCSSRPISLKVDTIA